MSNNELEINHFYRVKDGVKIWVIPLQRSVIFPDIVVFKLTNKVFNNRTVFGVLCQKIGGRWVPIENQDIELSCDNIEKEVNEDIEPQIVFVDLAKTQSKSVNSFPNIPNGSYAGIMGGYCCEIKVSGAIFIFTFEVGYRGVGIPKTVTVKDGYGYITY